MVFIPVIGLVSAQLSLSQLADYLGLLLGCQIRRVLEIFDLDVHMAEDLIGHLEVRDVMPISAEDSLGRVHRHLRLRCVYRLFSTHTSHRVALVDKTTSNHPMVVLVPAILYHISLHIELRTNLRVKLYLRILLYNPCK